MVFFNRERELAELDDLLRQDGPQFLVVYGRRRIGKTTLLSHWIDRHGAKTSAYWVAHRTTSDVLLRGFSDTIASLLPARPQGIVFADWNAALQQIFVLARQQRLVVVFDEFPYLVESVPEIPTLLQKLWDQESRETQVILVLCGSHYHMMHHQFLSPRQPLYGRATAVVRVEEMGHGDLGQFLPRYGAKQLVETYSVIGGVPKYLELWDDHVSVLQNVERLILSPASLFRHEALMLIQDEITEPRTYLAILECLGAGLKTPADLARDTGIAVNHMGKYLHTLVELRLVRRVLSEDAPDRNRTRVSRYEIRDPFLRFYFEFLYRHPELIEQNRMGRLAELIRSGFDSYVGRTGYEELARRAVAELGDRRELPFEPLYIGRAWDRRVELDVIAISHRERAALVGECKWQASKMGPGDLTSLRQRAEALKRLRDFKKHYALFSRSGFTKPLVQQAIQEDVLLFNGPDFQRIS
jgi:uncharacterized protein